MNPSLSDPPSDPATSPKPTPPRDRKVYTIQGWRRWALTPLTTSLNLWLSTLRVSISPTSRKAIEATNEPIVFVLWHNRLFLVPEIFRRFRKRKDLYALISASKDGAWLADFFSMVGIQSVRGSSSRFGREAILALVEELRAGHDIGITPDGPRGPRYSFKAGSLTVARRTKAPCVLIGVVYESAWRLSSWDKFYLPKPFSRARLVARTIRAPDASVDEEAPEQVPSLLRQINPDPIETEINPVV